MCSIFESLLTDTEKCDSLPKDFPVPNPQALICTNI